MINLNQNKYHLELKTNKKNCCKHEIAVFGSMLEHAKAKENREYSSVTLKMYSEQEQH